MPSVLLPPLHSERNCDFASSAVNCKSPVRVVPKLRVGVLLDSLTTPAWIHKTLEEIISNECSKLVLIVLNGGPRKASRPKNSALFRLWSWFDYRLFGTHGDAFTTERRDYVAETITAVPIDKDGSDRLDDGTIAKIKTANLDVILQLGFSLLTGEVLSCAKYGVWTFQSTDGMDPEVFYPFFWKQYDTDRLTEITLRVAHTGRALYRGCFLNDSLSLHRNRNSDRWRRSRILLRRLSDLHAHGWQDTSAANSEEIASSNGFGHTLPGNALTARFAAQWCLHVLRKELLELCFCEQWFICCRKTLEPVVGDRNTRPFTILKPPPGSNYADPFVFEHGGHNYIFFEAWQSGSKGAIWCTKLDQAGKPGESKPILQRPYHLSYPYVFEWRGGIYLLPETRQNKTIELFRAIDFPYHWELAAVLMKGVSAVDSVIFEYNSKLWLFTAGMGGPEVRLNELSLFFADSLFGPWRPHPKNPIVCDIRRARPAGGLFIHNGELIRPGQNCSKSYGYAVSLNRVDLLSESDYREEPIAMILPNWAPDICRVHTFNRNGTFEVRDASVIVPRRSLKRPCEQAGFSKPGG